MTITTVTTLIRIQITENMPGLLNIKNCDQASKLMLYRRRQNGVGFRSKEVIFSVRHRGRAEGGEVKPKCSLNFAELDPTCPPKDD